MIIGSLAVTGYMLIVGALLYGNHRERLNRPTVAPPPPEPAFPADLQWLLDQPAQVRLTDTEVGIRLRDIEFAEGWAR